MSTQPAGPSKDLQSAMNWAGFALNIAPAILQLVATIQQLFGKGNGAKKAKVAQTVIQAAAPGVNPAVVQPVIDASVTAMKEAGHPAFATSEPAQ